MRNSRFNFFLLTVLIVGTAFFAAYRLNWFRSMASVPVNLRIVNVLSEKFFNDAHIKGAPGVTSINAPFEKFDALATDWDKKIPIVVHCSNYFCSASHVAAKKLQAMGFETVYAYEAGTAEWYQRGNAIEGPAEESYLSMEVSKPAEEKTDVTVISTEDLKKMIKTATLPM